METTGMVDARDEVIVQCSGLQVEFHTAEGEVRAVNGADFVVKRGRTLGVVGESGCGKSVTAQAILRIIPAPGRIVGGEITYNLRSTAADGTDVTEKVVLTDLDARGKEIRRIRGRHISMIFQEPLTSLSPVHTIGNQIIEAIRLHQDVDKQQAREQAIEMLRLVGMPNPEQTIDSYPHQLSGGMRQRGMIARSLCCHPSLLIADEPTSALDVTTQAQILYLMQRLQKELDMSIMMITHDLGVVAETADDVIVMYLGRVVESADVDSLFYDPKHPYTRALLRSIPRVDRDTGEKLEAIKGVVPDPFAFPSGCSFHPRCASFMKGVCDVTEPPEVRLGDGRTVRCHLYAQSDGV